ncbi:hypothetical protein DITRI_Ditri20bG0141900 [Diplodiscus trichospermus]
MCSVLGLQMENYQGDLNDIVWASGGPMGYASAQASDTVQSSSSWQQFPPDPLIFSSSAMEVYRGTAFGDPFSTLRDPLLHELNMDAGSSTYFSSPNPTNRMIDKTGSSTSVEDTSNFCGASNIVGHSKIFEDDIRSPCNIFPRIQISPSSNKVAVSPCDSPVMAADVSPMGIKEPAAVLANDKINANSSKSCLIDNTGLLQISSPRNLGIKRRKSQVKKVVCIPAPAAANSRPSGEVVPSDLWAWRKYGQKPIKGSPYPRGYYRCSSSKGCSARKQVERSRADPSMLVITYTSEHNHPWPTQRNAIAGSARSQPSKNNSSASKISSPSSQPQYAVNTKEELKESSNDALSLAIAASSTASASVKEDIVQDIDEQLDADDAEFGEGIPKGQTYKPALPDSHQSEDFFADLDEIQADPCHLLFSQGFSTDQDEQKERKAMDPFSLFDWSRDNSASF